MKNIIIFALTISLIYVFIDFNERFIVDKNDQVSDFEYEWKKEFNQPTLLSEEQAFALKKAYLKFNVQEEIQSKITEQVLSSEEQRAQNGILTKLYIGDWLYHLRAIIYPKEKQAEHPFALLSGVNLKSSEVKIEKVINNEMFFNYNVVIRDTSFITFSNKENKQKIELKMYSLKE